jgi:methylmalonyl-CoA mutase
MFAPATADDWRAAAAAELKGASPDTLRTHTYEGIDQPPISWPADIATLPHLATRPGQSPFLRGARAATPADGPWLVCASIAPQAPATAAELLREALNCGATALELSVDHAQDLGTQLAGVVPAAVALYLRVPAGQLRAAGQALAELAGSDARHLRGALVLDPVARLAAGEQGTNEPAMLELAALADWARAPLPQVTTLTSDASIYHEAGGSAVEELAFGLAGIVEQLRRVAQLGGDAAQLARQVRFEYALGTSILTEVAKLRAARLLWARVAAAFGAPPNARSVHLHARGAARNQTRYDRTVNLLRGAVEGFAAVLGGCDSLALPPFDSVIGPPSALAGRLALNTQHLLRDEALLGLVRDPCGGAWALELRSDALARRAWALFQEVERRGGMCAALQAGFPQARIAEVAAQRASDLASRRRVLVGTSRYADPAEPLPGAGPDAGAQREAAPFERLRDAVLSLDHRPEVWYALVGPREAAGPRADFVADLLQLAAIGPGERSEFANGEAVADAALTSGAPLIALCARDADYPALLPQIARISAGRPEALILLAGYPPGQAEALASAGVDVFVHARGDALAALERIVAHVTRLPEVRP